MRLTTAQALVRFLANQYSERDGIEQRLIPGMWGIFGHGNVAGLGQGRGRRDPRPVGVAVGPAGDELVETLEREANEVRVGPGDDAASDMGPVVTSAARERVARSVASGAEQGATVVVDGRGLVVEGHEDGFFVGPSLLDHVTTEMDAYHEEIFGTAIFTGSGEAARQFQREVKIGMIGVNVPIPVPMSYFPTSN